MIRLALLREEHVCPLRGSSDVLHRQGIDSHAHWLPHSLWSESCCIEHFLFSPPLGCYRAHLSGHLLSAAFSEDLTWVTHFSCHLVTNLNANMQISSLRITLSQCGCLVYGLSCLAHIQGPQNKSLFSWAIPQSLEQNLTDSKCWIKCSLIQNSILNLTFTILLQGK